MKSLFLTNYTEQTFLERIKDNLRQCDSFSFSVSFIKKAGLDLLSNHLEASLARGVKGKIITSTYQNFTDIESLNYFRRLMDDYDNFECRLDFESFHDNAYSVIGFHSKGYYFEFGDEAELIIGSSNITRYALLKNIEWDLVVKDNKTEIVFENVKAEYYDKWNNSFILDRDIINQYYQKLNYAIERWDMDYESPSELVKPNYMQRRAMKELNRYRTMGISKALVVAASGSGKTYLAAFDARNFNPRKLLYIVHEGSILHKALDSFQKVFGNTVSYGIFNKDSKDIDTDFLFAGNIILSKNLELFRQDEFDYIILDECHHAIANTYKRIINYFKPAFLVGLTATPERMDNEDVFELFDTNVPFELRLRDAIINELVVPFHYYGIRDSLIDYGLKPKEEYKMIAQLATEEHCEFIKEKIEKYRPKGKLKAIAFCKNINHARMMSEGLLEQGYKTAYLTGKNNIGERISAYNDLQSNEEGSLEILCTVDILNEGVDIPGCNMILFLRPTESATIFIQQLGRGLRKYKDKTFATVLDFIGNSYRRSVQIALAMGSLSQNYIMEKTLMKSLVKDNYSALGLEEYGVKIDFDKESQKDIINYIDKENFNKKSYLEQDYKNFKQYINVEDYPKHMDYFNNDCAPDLLKFMKVRLGNNNNRRVTGCYYNFLKEIGEENIPLFKQDQIDFIKYASNLIPLVRKHEFLVIKNLIKKELSKDELTDVLKDNIQNCSEGEIDHTLEFMQRKGAISKLKNKYTLNIELDDQLIEYLEDLIDYGISRYDITYKNDERFVLWQSYRIDQVQLKLLKNPEHNQKGTYFYDDEAIVFAELKKDSSVEDRLKYKNKFLQSNLLQWECEINIREKDLKKLRACKCAHIFIRKVANEHGITLPFIYVGEGHFTNERRQEKMDFNTRKESVTYLYDIPLDNDLPDYLQYDFEIIKN
ncbi:MAG: DUF3427 domain-containing protein [Eubacterium sp.]|nr:DUF3427 domain-containing protein [Eubacterium sp.]